MDLRFDLYSVVKSDNQYHVIQLSKGIPMVIAQILAGVSGQDFQMSVINTGWVGTCPQWRGFQPMVTLPKGERLGEDQLNFMMSEIK